MTIETTITESADRAGHVVPPGWTITAGLAVDHARHPRDATSYSTDEWLAFWCGDWGYVTVAVRVADEYGRVLTTQTLHAVEHGWLPDATGTLTLLAALDLARPHMSDLITQALNTGHAVARAYARNAQTLES